MVGYQRTHRYPHGKPVALVLLDIAIGLILVLWVFLVPGHWPRAIEIIVIVFVIAFMDSRLHLHYERTGQAVKIPRQRVVVKFAHGLPGPMLVARLGFFVSVGIMVVLGVAPISDSLARSGIISCGFALIAVAVLNLALERHYIRTGQAKERDT